MTKTKKVLLGISITLLMLFVALVATFQYSRTWDRGFILEPFSKIDTTDKVIALTFDDGPSETRTPALLELLAEEDVTATFFMLGDKIEKYPEIAQQVFDGGHLIGNHSYDHSRLIFRTPSFINHQIDRTEKLIKNLGVAEVEYFRPPYSSKYIILPWQLKKMNKTLVTGTYDPPAEYQSPYPAKLVAEQVLDNLQPGAIIYLHDGKEADGEAFIESIKLIINGAREQGYEFVTIDYK